MNEGDIQLFGRYVCSIFCYIELHFILFFYFSIFSLFVLLDGFMILQLIVYYQAAYATMDAEDYCIC